MIAIPPIDCTAPGVLVSTNAANAAAWSGATIYAADAVVSYANRNWTSVQAGNLAKTPGTDDLWWIDSGPTNSMAMFDTAVSTVTTRIGGLTWTLATGRFTALGLLGLVGQAVTITITDGATTLYTETRTLQSSDGTYYSWCFEDFLQTREVAFYGLPSSPTAQITIAITAAAASPASCGLCVLGKQVYIGDAQYGFSTPIEDRGRHYLDSLGNPVNVERGYSKGVNGTIETSRVNYNRMQSFFADNIGIPLLWIATPDQADLISSTVFGRYVRAVPVIESYSSITANLEIAGYR